MPEMKGVDVAVVGSGAAGLAVSIARRTSRRLQPWVVDAAFALPKLAQLNRDAFVVDEAETTVRLDEHRGNFDIGDSDLGADDGNAA